MFATDLKLKALPGERWELLEPLVWEEGFSSCTVPAGFVTDLASIPRIFQWLPHFGVNGRSRRPAVLHDYLYSLMRIGAFTKAEADATFGRALKAEGLNRVTCSIYYRAVHHFGGR